jgi:GNAT superfamily N-acetyltransferase
VIADAALARRVESLQAAVHGEVVVAMQRMRPEIGATMLVSGDGNAAFTGAGSPLTQAIGLALSAPIDDDELSAIEELYFSRGADSIVHVTPWSDPSLAAKLAERGYAIHEFENVFVRATRHPERSEGSGRAARQEVEVVQITEDEIPTWARIAAEAFATEGTSADTLTDIMTPFGYAEHARNYIAYLDGEPAGSASAFALPGRGLVGLFGAGTRERFRNRGVQAALLERRLADAAESGCEIAMVTTLPGSGSHRNVARSGFELIYTKVSMRRAFRP